MLFGFLKFIFNELIKSTRTNVKQKNKKKKNKKRKNLTKIKINLRNKKQKI